MRDQLHELEETDVVVVTFAQPDELPNYHTGLGVPFPMVADTERNIYRRFGLERGSVREVWNIGSLWLYLRLLVRGRRIHKPRHDTQQLGGDFIIGPDGRLVAAFRPRSPDDRPTVRALFDAAIASA